MARAFRLAPLLLAPLFLLLPVLIAATPASAGHVDLDELVQIAPWDVLDTITEPQFNDAPYVLPQDEVVGLAIGNESHTYPLKLMNWHEVINDEVGGVPVVVSYCPLCGSAIANERDANGTVLTFRTSGLLFRNNKVMFDVETQSLWPQILGEAINGSFHGTRLRFLPTARMSFGEWKGLHPDTQVVGRPWGEVLCPAPCRVPAGFEGYGVNPYAQYQAGNETFAPILFNDTRLHPKTFVAGVERGGDAWAIPLPQLLARRAVVETVGEESLVAAVVVHPDRPTLPPSVHVYEAGEHEFEVDPVLNELIDDEGGRYAIATGQGSGGTLDPVRFFYGFWFAWNDLHPDSRVFGVEGSPGFDPALLLVVGALGLGTLLALLVVRRWRRRKHPPHGTRGGEGT